MRIAEKLQDFLDFLCEGEKYSFSGFGSTNKHTTREVVITLDVVAETQQGIIELLFADGAKVEYLLDEDLLEVESVSYTGITEEEVVLWWKLAKEAGDALQVVTQTASHLEAWRTFNGYQVGSKQRKDAAMYVKLVSGEDIE